MRLVNLLRVDSVQHPEHGAATAGPDGVFELPEEFGRALLAHPAQWRTEAEHVAEAARKRLEELADPKRAAEVLDFVHGRVRSLEDEVSTLREELSGRVSDLEAAAAPAEPVKSAKTAKSTADDK